MGVRIRNVYIENFRSIQKLNVDTNKLAIFVGKNDSGKSNILRALNLFFNGVTNPGKNFNFDDDYNLFVPEKAKSAKEIIVRVELDIPNSYHSTNGQIIVWEKKWRSSGLHSDEYWGARLGTTKRGRETRERVDLSEKSNAHGLLRQIDFEYVPAIKDAHYFNDLRGRIYAIISEAASRTFRNSSTAFEEAIGSHLADLTSGLDETLGFATRLALPRDLSHIFQRLDFLSGERSISLDHRGDGIKVRHIPLILKFMAEKKSSLQVRGTAPYSFIWAYEEPENNLEFTNAVELAAQLASFAKSDVAQILLTTHSPVFYDLGDNSDIDVSCSHVFRDTDVKGTDVSASGSDVDETMGTMSLLAPRVKQLVHEIREQVEAKNVAEQLALQDRPKIFVEGDSDKIFLQKCTNVFFPELANRVDFETKSSGGGHSFVIDMLNGWRSHHKHHPERPKAAGIVDADAEDAKREWNRGSRNTESAKCFCYPKPAHAIAALQSGFRLPVTLEVLYPRSVWEWAEGEGLLEDCERAKIFPPEIVERLLKGEAGELNLDDAYSIYVTRKFATGSKIKTARHVASLENAQFEEQYAFMRNIIAECLNYLGVE